MVGLAANEKALFQRIGNLVDVLSFAQRQVANPGRGQARKQNKTVPVPQNVTATGIVSGVEVKWDAVDIGELEFYELHYGETSTFSSFKEIQTVGTRVVIKDRISSGSLFIRLRAVSKRGLCSNWTATSNVTTDISYFNSDQDAIEPENRSAVLPKPELLGSALAASSGDDYVFVGVGANVGPSPINLDDTGQTDFATNVNVRHDITYVLHENATPYPGLEACRLETIGDRYLEQEEDTFYTYSPSFYIYPHVLSGSFTDFFDVATVTTDPAQVDVEMLRYQDSLNFYVTHYRQAGFIYNAVMSNIKF